jgi:hypothetical protein
LVGRIKPIGTHVARHQRHEHAFFASFHDGVIAIVVAFLNHCPVASLKTAQVNQNAG